VKLHILKKEKRKRKKGRDKEVDKERKDYACDHPLKASTCISFIRHDLPGSLWLGYLLCQSRQRPWTNHWFRTETPDHLESRFFHKPVNIENLESQKPLGCTALYASLV
jgi:hypothetical protein